MNHMKLQTPRLSCLRLSVGLSMTIAVGLLGSASSANAQLAPQGTQNVSHGYVRGIDAAHDAQRNVYLVVGGQGPLRGVFVGADGTPGPGFQINNSSQGYGAFPRVAYSPQANGGQGAFLVAWASEEGPSVVVRGRMFAYPGTPLTNEILLSGNISSYLDASPLDLAYSPTSQRFFVAWKSGGRAENTRVYGVLVNTSGAPEGPVVQLSDTFGRDPGVTWNSSNNEFGVSFNTEYMSGTQTTGYGSAFVRVPATNAAAFSRLAFNSLPAAGYQTGATDITYNPATNRYIIGFVQLNPGSQANTKIATIKPNGELDTFGIASYQLGTMDGISLAGNPSSHTTLLVGPNPFSDVLMGAELNSLGYRFSSELTLDSASHPVFHPQVSEHSSAATWLISFSAGVASLNGQRTRYAFMAAKPVNTSTTGGGPAGSYAAGGSSGGGGSTGGGTSPSGCTTVNPGPAFSCVNGSWAYTGGSTGGGGTGTGGTTGGCTTVSPGAAFSCVNGSWIYTGGGSGTGTGGTTGGCSTVNPGPAFSCVNGSWVYGGGGSTGGSGTGGTTGGCTTVNPGPAFSCVNGSWVYGGGGSGAGGGSTSTCTTVRPGPTWTCVNGNWLPPSSSSSLGAVLTIARSVEPAPIAIDRQPPLAAVAQRPVFI